MAEARRLFFALWPEPGLQRTAAATAASAAQAAGVRGRTVAPDGMHLTLLFLGSVASADEPRLHDIAAAIVAEAFELRLDRVDCFAKARVLWLGCRNTPDALGALARKLREGVAAAGIEFDRKPLVPHLTCLRDIDRPLTPVAIAPLAWKVDRFALVHSAAGSRYHVVSHWGLQT